LPNVEDQPKGDRRAGVIWHTQGSGKSLSMVFYVGKLVLAQEMNNPTLRGADRTATTWISSFLKPSATASNCYAKPRCKPAAAKI